MEVVMFKKWLKPNFFISAQLHAKIAGSCTPIERIDSQVLDVRTNRHNLRRPDQVKNIKNEFVYCFTSR